ncbi:MULTISPECIES: Rne/Rng family ribonuclease [unclassified Okeania]|uniref:Rne/Rng family ribonuclease n=1 Tax=unclassified Okeania TaxID=2634635 RepID=UPI0013B8D351|nr:MULTISPECIES: Rne/Rng family ribonuclease [unclassified Okeania]NES77565.1 Rne/Rng family ribonuclease [Okeania sp. SIO1H4]NET21191.1 Rne/Rng family ribonuclease [Okeania sp. SIO1H5]NET95252.1 Rne/Rng family ribonuclease [Okeania sp. SIO1H2]
MPKQIIIAEQHRIAAVFSEDQIQELVVATGSHQVSDIYLGVVENVLPGIDAAFVNIGDPERNGFIHVSDLGPLRLKRSSGAITELLTPQQKVLVQVMKEPTGTKGPRLTGNITLPGRYLVLMPYGRGVNLSRRIRSENERNRLRALAILIKPAGMGLLVRTEAEGMEEEAILEDLELLQKQWETVQMEGNSNRAPALLNRDSDFIQRVLRDMYSTDVNRIVVDSNEAVKRVKKHLLNWSGGKPLQVLIDYHSDRIPILEYFRVNAAIREALRPRVDLPSGGYIIIQPTEALTVIDVNSGSFTRSATARETVLWTNCEAATEIARQLRLRNIAGVIIVDFIDMDSRRDQLQVLEHFNQVLKADKARPQIAQLSELGLVELTRKRQGQNVYELFGHTCPSCNGLGHLVRLPGESEIPMEEVNLPVVSRTPEVEETIRPVPIAPPTLVTATQTPTGETTQGYQEVESTNNSSDLELLNHPSYQESNRRRRRRRVGVGETMQDESLELQEREMGTDMEYPMLSEGYPLTTPNRRPGREIIRPITEPPEIVTVEMTPDEQDVYALMGISPITLLEEGTVKNPKSVIISIQEPGENSVRETTEKKEDVELESEVEYEEEDNDEEPQLEVEEVDSSMSLESEDQSDFDSDEENGQYEAELSDSDVDLSSDSNDSDDSGPIRRRRRRSSAATEE